MTATPPADTTPPTAAPERTMPPLAADERTSLASWLDFYRATLAHKCEGLEESQLREASVGPSPITLLGLVRHMAEVERNWFRRVLAQEHAPPLFTPEATGTEAHDGGFDLPDGATYEEALPCGRPRSATPAGTAPPAPSTTPLPSWAARSPCAGSTPT